MSEALVVGVNKYSHDASVVLVGVESGRVLFAAAKERVSRRKHDGGGVASLVKTALDTVGVGLEAVVAVYQGNHHRAVCVDERPRVLRGSDGDPHNLFPSVPADRRAEVTHHLAHALGAAATAVGEDSEDAPRPPFLCVVMDGMGERADRFGFGVSPGSSSSSHGDGGEDVHVVSDAGLHGWTRTVHEVCLPSRHAGMTSQWVPDAHREAETCYLVEESRDGDSGLYFTPVFKRWCAGTRGDGEVGYGDWFLGPNDSIGAVYSDVAHRVFGDWNACGKVMGLAPWASPQRDGHAGHAGWGGEALKWADLARRAAERVRRAGEGGGGKRWILRGDVWPTSSDTSLKRGSVSELLEIAAVGTVLEGDPDWPPSDEEAEAMGGLWHGYAPVSGPVRDAVRACCAALACTLQRETEEVTLAFLDACQTEARARVEGQPGRHLDVVLCGGVALNSVLNGKVETWLHESGRGGARTFVPPAPGDEGAALGCAVAALSAFKGSSAISTVDGSLLPFAGALYGAKDMEAALREYRGWLVPHAKEEDLDVLAMNLAAGSVVFWFEGRGEWGPRALGHRSILVDPRDARAVDVVNARVKFREDFRPLAPAVLEEHAGEWFETAGPGGVSRTMGKVWAFRDAERASRGPACAHADLSARPQTVPAGDGGPLRRYRQLVEAFYAATGVPFVLNTSFNTRPREPPVDSPADAVGAFLFASVQGGEEELNGRAAGRMLLCLSGDGGGVFVPAKCPVDEAQGRLREGLRADSVFAERRHDAWEVVRRESHDAEESVELVVRGGLGDAAMSVVHPLTDALEAEIYLLCDGSRPSVQALLHALVDDNPVADEYDDLVSEADILRRLARLWRCTLVRLECQM